MIRELVEALDVLTADTPMVLVPKTYIERQRHGRF
jgi:hypothetical protein